MLKKIEKLDDEMVDYNEQMLVDINKTKVKVESIQTGFQSDIAPIKKDLSTMKDQMDKLCAKLLPDDSLVKSKRYLN